MTWAEVDLVRRLWTLPGTRTKNGKPHVVQLSDLAVAVIRAPTAFQHTGLPCGRREAVQPVLQGKASPRRTLRSSGLAIARSAPDDGFRHGSPWGGAAYRRQDPQPRLRDNLGRGRGLSATRVYARK